MSMLLRARVKNGRIILDEPTDLPEGTELDLVPSEEDALDAEDQARLQHALEAAFDELREGKGVAAGQVLSSLRHRGQ
jgi:hypothetical protein